MIVSFLGAGTIGTALGNVIASAELHKVTLLSIEEQVVRFHQYRRHKYKVFPYPSSSSLIKSHNGHRADQ